MQARAARRERAQLLGPDAGDGASAIAAARECRPDIVILDVMLPDMDGFTVTRRIRESGAHLPIVFVTGYADAEALAHAGDAGVIQKPFEDHELASKLRAVLESLSS